jgi:uncharacterized damage-inducible protein DinB
MNSMQNVLERLAQAPQELITLLRDLSAEAIRTRNSADEFSALETVCHLRDLEIEGYGVRINKILTDDNPTLPDIDGSRLAIERDYNSQEVTEALEAFTMARQQNITVLKQVSEDQLERTGLLTGVGEVSLDKLLSMMSEHDDDHLDDVRRIRQRWLKNSSSS